MIPEASHAGPDRYPGEDGDSSPTKYCRYYQVYDHDTTTGPKGVPFERFPLVEGAALLV